MLPGCPLSDYRDQGGDSLTVKPHARRVSLVVSAQIEDVRERVSLQLGESPNEALNAHPLSYLKYHTPCRLT
jgi:hypothetical protein